MNPGWQLSYSCPACPIPLGGRANKGELLCRQATVSARLVGHGSDSVVVEVVLLGIKLSQLAYRRLGRR